MEFILGSTSKLKINTMRDLLAKQLGINPVVSGMDVSSGVPDTPYEEETKRGACNRAQAIAQAHPDAYAIGLESGLVTRYGDMYEEAWCCIIYSDKQFLGYSSGLKIPDYVLLEMESSGQEHGPTLRAIREKIGIDNDKDTWGLYTDYVLLRRVSLEEALRNALIQATASAASLYSSPRST